MRSPSPTAHPIRVPLAGDALAALVWFVVIVPPSFGFWLVAGDLAGVSQADRPTLLAASMLCLGVATLVQVLIGHRLPVFEGPANTYLAALAVVSAGSVATHPDMIAGGLLAAGLFVFLLGVLRFDRVVARVFSPAVATVFMLVITIPVVPVTFERAIERGGPHSWGTGAGWIATLVVFAVVIAFQALPKVRPYGLLAALVLGTLAYASLEGLPGAAVGSAWVEPTVFPWGAPELSFAVIAPFLIAGALSSFNTIASINVMTATLEQPTPPGTERRGVLAHGGTQAIGATLGNVLGNVPRLDSAAIVRMTGDPRPRALAIAAVVTLVVAVIGPLAAALARLPIPVSAALVTVILALILEQGFRGAWQLDANRRWFVVAPALVPSFAWVVVSDDLSAHAQLLANPMLVGVLLAIVLDRVCTARTGGRSDDR